MASLDVLSCGVRFPDTTRVRDMLAQADVVFGSRALLAAYERFSGSAPASAFAPEKCEPDECEPGECEPSARSPRRGVEKRVIGAHARQDAADALRLFREGRRVVALASGDALYHGFGGSLAELLANADPDERARIRFWPGITAFQALFHRLGLPWQGVRLFSVHEPGQSGALPLREAAESPFAVVYGGARYPAHALAAAVCSFYPPAASRPAISADRIGSHEERIVRGSLDNLSKIEMSPTSFLVILPGESETAPILALGLPEQAYERERNLITAADARAVILARLRLPAWGTLWDVGAGSGSVGLEAAALRPNLRVIAFEREAERAAMIGRNALRLGVANHEVCTGNFPELVADSKQAVLPDRIFVGGGGRALPAVLEACFAALRPEGLLLVSAVTLESVHLVHGWRPESRIGICSLDIAVEQPLAGSYHHLRPQRRLTLYTFSRLQA